MAKNPNPLVLNPAALLALPDPPGKLDNRQRKALEQQLAEQLRIGREADAAQRAVAAVYLTTLRTADETLTLAELIKATRWPCLAPSELSALDRQRREQFLERLNEIADRANEKIVQRSNR